MFHKPRKPLAKESPKTRRLRRYTANDWFRLNPPDENGEWECWLQISTLCPKQVIRETITLEHVYPKVRYPELKFAVENIKPSCSFCNKMKSSKTPEDLARAFHHIAILIQTDEWKSWELNLKEKYAIN